jgi:hypothetical protein
LGVCIFRASQASKQQESEEDAMKTHQQIRQQVIDTTIGDLVAAFYEAAVEELGDVTRAERLTARILNGLMH